MESKEIVDVFREAEINKKHFSKDEINTLENILSKILFENKRKEKSKKTFLVFHIEYNFVPNKRDNMESAW